MNVLAIAMAVVPALSSAPEVLFDQGYVVSPTPKKCHSSSVVQSQDGDLLTCWFYGVGERKDDTLVIQGAWKRKGEKDWGEPFVMADSQDLPDCNPVLFIDPRGTLWLFWAAIQNNEWGGALLKYRTSTRYAPGSSPQWDWQDVIHCRPRDLETHWTEFLRTLDSSRSERLSRVTEAAHSKLARRIGWMGRTHPVMLPGNRLLLGLYSDVFNCSLAASTEDWGKTWEFSDPILGVGNIQPSFCLRKQGDVVAFMRDGGRERRIRTSASQDGGVTWSDVGSLSIPNPGSSVECIVLRNGYWLLVCNDTIEGRDRLTAYLSSDEGATWQWKRSLETNAVQASYPSVIQLEDGTIYCTYTYYPPRDAEGRKIRSIKWANFNEAWVQTGDAWAEK